jgi:hypothetical protein
VVLGPHPARASVPRAAPSAGLDPLQREKTPGTGYLKIFRLLGESLSVDRVGG